MLALLSDVRLLAAEARLSTVFGRLGLIGVRFGPEPAAAGDAAGAVRRLGVRAVRGRLAAQVAGRPPDQGSALEPLLVTGPDRILASRFPGRARLSPD
ncbi:hypothetical protein [Actinoplanes siamensis]|uniref:Uncharacterized protein n=1 Tax=Actinoplanes siamensis TaxID=1223317 RepID=A0A919N3T3_9ACTN|nr:hypothetical protein [Actinoplanes siamensis]GIF03874.1 hypothetical protein Asi03nite_14120 [Actinoplanes siamensis]